MNQINVLKREDIIHINHEHMVWPLVHSVWTCQLSPNNAATTCQQLPNSVACHYKFYFYGLCICDSTGIGSQVWMPSGLLYISAHSLWSCCSLGHGMKDFWCSRDNPNVHVHIRLLLWHPLIFHYESKSGYVKDKSFHHEAMPKPWLWFF